MSSPQRSASHPPPPLSTQLSTTTHPPQSSSPVGAQGASGALANPASSPPNPAPPVFTPAEMTTAILDLGQAVAGIRAFLSGPYAPLPPSQFTYPPQQQQLLPPPPSTGVIAPPVSYPGAAPTFSPGTTMSSEGVPIQQIRFPPSPSPLLTWVAGSLEPVYTGTGTQPHLPPHSTSSATMAHGGIPASGVLYGGVDGPLFHGGSPMPSFFAPSSSVDNAGGPSMPGGATLPAVHNPPPPKFSKLEFPTYDGSVDPLNWLNQCDQFFRGQRTIASERTWLASYHLRGAA